VFVQFVFCDLGSRDSKIALWRIEDDGGDTQMDVPNFNLAQSAHSNTPSYQVEESSLPAERRDITPLSIPTYNHIEPLCVKMCEKAEKVRAFAYNDHRQVCCSGSSISI